jgi:hypothetical protein
MKKLVLLSACIAFAGCSGGSSVAGTACPSEAEVRAALTRYITVDYWSAGQRDIWKIKSVSDFSFGPVKFGSIVKKQVEYGKAAEDVCPVRVEYSFTTENQSGEKKQTKMGENQTQLFYKDPFGDWVFKTG